jgi:hypothetical protein
MGVAGGLIDDGVTPKETSTLRVGSAGRAASQPMFNRIILIRHSGRLNDGVDKTRASDGGPQGAVCKPDSAGSQLAQITRRSPRVGARQCSSTAVAPSDSLIVVSGGDVGGFLEHKSAAWLARQRHRSHLQQQAGKSRCRYLTSSIGTETKNPSVLCAAQRCGSHVFNATRWITINARFTARCARTLSLRSSNADRRRLRASAVLPQNR